MKKTYNTPLLLQQTPVCLETNLLAASVVDNMTVESTGQEVGGTYDYSQSTTFNHEWGE